MPQPLPLPTLTSYLHSRGALVVLIVFCFALVWTKLDSISRNLAQHQHPAEESIGDHVHSHVSTALNPARAAHTGEETAHQHGPFHAATHPPQGALSLVPEWAPVKAVAMALPESRSRDAGYLRLLADLAQAFLQRANVNVIVLIEQNDVRGRARCDDFIDDRQLDRTRIEFYEAKSLDTVWLRDYGPIFVRRRSDRQLFVVDTAYRDVRLVAEEAGAAMLGLGTALRPSDDLAPIYFATRLNKPFVHPGFALNGGDLYADGQGALYTSDDTLHLNTGDREYVSGAVLAYFGVRDVRYLRSLPGPTVKHIDMLFKLVSPGRCLVGKYGPVAEDDAELIGLQRAAARALDENAAQLAEQGLRVDRIAMPNITKITKWDYYDRALGDAEFAQRVAAMAKDAELPVERIREKLETTFTYTYRTYLNSVLIVTPLAGANPARRVLIVPRYAEAAELEAGIEVDYRQAYEGDLELVFVDAETLAHANGSLRCIVCPIPAD